MSEQEIFNLHHQEELLVLNKKDQPLKPSQVDDLEGPPDPEEPLRLPDFLAVKKELEIHGLEVLGEREPWSGGIFGPIFRIKTRDTATGEEKYIIERTFTEVKDIERRFALVNQAGSETTLDSEPRYEIINRGENKNNKLVVDYLYNEEKALRDLQGTIGIPKFYGAAYDDLLGSTLQEYIDGFDMSAVWSQEKISAPERVLKILAKIREVYLSAAQKGYVHGNPLGGTTMVDQQDQPYLTDWYLYTAGSVKADSDVQEKYQIGLQSLDDLAERIKADIPPKN